MCSHDVASEELFLYEIGHDTCEYYKSDELLKSAKFMNTDPDFWVFRRFGKLHLFNILRIQQHLIRLEKELDEKISENEEGTLLLPEIQRTLKEYDAALLAQARFTSYRQPENHMLDHLKNTTSINARALGKALKSCSRDEGTHPDLASIAGSEKSWTHRYIDRHGFLNRRFEKKSQKVNSQYSTLVYSEQSVRQAVAVFLHVRFCLLLLGSIAALLYVHRIIWKLLIVALSIIAASLLSVGLLDQLNKNSLGLVAGYAAILVVFMSNNVG